MLKSQQEVKVSYKLLSQNSTVTLNPCVLPLVLKKINFVVS